MLRESLKDSDIPHRTILRERILERLTEHMDKLKKDMSVCIYKTLYCHII